MLTTEQVNPNTSDIDRLATIDALHLINREDQQVADAVAQVIPAIARAVDGIAERLERGGRLVYVGTGTSGRLGVLDAAECPPTFGVPPEMVQGLIAGGYEACYRAVEASEDDADAGANDLATRGINSGDAIVGIAASGRTPYTIGALRYARKLGALTICITCNKETPLADVVEIPIEPVVGPEVIAGSTRLKSGTAQKLVLNMLSTMTMVRLGYVTGNRMTSVQTRNAKLRERALRLMREEFGIDEVDAQSALDASGWDLRVAIVMKKTGATREEAERAIRESQYVIARAIERLEFKL
jgi:N-acetylmuramic acid 6-phosphate etherase